MYTETTQDNPTTNEQPLNMAMELSNTEWRLGFSIGLGQKPRLRKLKTRDVIGLMEEIRKNKV